MAQFKLEVWLSGAVYIEAASAEEAVNKLSALGAEEVCFQQGKLAITPQILLDGRLIVWGPMDATPPKPTSYMS